MPSRLKVDREQIARFCRAHHVRKLSLFGSVLRDDFRPESDVDVLVEFEEGRTPGLIEFSQLEEELGPLFGGRRLDVVTPSFLNARIRDRVMASSEVAYAEG
jgi:predicted nucleotidyltransferase